MTRNRKRGLTLVELLMVTAIMGILSVASVGLLSSSFQAYDQGQARFDLQREGLLAMERMTDAARISTFLLVPNAHSTPRTVLALTGLTNDDDDYYFDDPLFPRIDEDLGFDMNEDGFNGIVSIDEDGDGSIDERSGEFSGRDDDEDGRVGEDHINGIDDDGDGNIDEDLYGDTNLDGAPGIAGVDDDGDGLVDEGSMYDDDEDGTLDEIGIHPVVFQYDADAGTLTEWNTITGDTVVLSEKVKGFKVDYQRPQLITITLILQSGDDELEFVENVCLRNVEQKTGKRVR